MYTYAEVMEILMHDVGIPKDIIFDFTLSPQSGFYEGYYEFCQQDLLGDAYKNNPDCPFIYDFKQSYFFFRNHFSVNARAGISCNNYLISVNSGYMNLLYETYFINNYPLKSKAVFAKYVFLENIGFGPIEKFMYNLTLQFTYFHEKAHLYQKRDSSFWINESYDYSDGKFDFKDHVLEFDADIHAVYWVCQVLISYHMKLKSEWQNAKTMTMIICLGTAAILTYFTKLQDDFKSMYFEDKSHPHAINRIMYILNAFIQFLEKRIPQLMLNREKIVLEAFAIAKELLHSHNSTLVSFNVSDLTIILEIHEKGITNYVKKLGDTAFSGDMPFLTIHKLVND